MRNMCVCGACSEVFCLQQSSKGQNQVVQFTSSSLSPREPSSKHLELPTNPTSLVATRREKEENTTQNPNKFGFQFHPLESKGVLVEPLLTETKRGLNSLCNQSVGSTLPSPLEPKGQHCAVAQLLKQLILGSNGCDLPRSDGVLGCTFSNQRGGFDFSLLLWIHTFFVFDSVFKIWRRGGGWSKPPWVPQRFEPSFGLCEHHLPCSSSNQLSSWWLKAPWATTNVWFKSLSLVCPSPPPSP